MHIGANGLAAPRDFQTPVARFEDRECSFTVMHKLCGRMFQAQQKFSPFDVVAWHGNFAPYKYDLARFCPVNTVRLYIYFMFPLALLSMGACLGSYSSEAEELLAICFSRRAWQLCSVWKSMV